MITFVHQIFPMFAGKFHYLPESSDFYQKVPVYVEKNKLRRLEDRRVEQTKKSE